MDKEIFKTYKIRSFALNPHNFEWQYYALESISIQVDKFAVSNPQLSDLGSKPQFSSALYLLWRSSSFPHSLHFLGSLRR